MKVLITGENGFIAKNLKIFLKDRSDIEIFKFSKKNKISELVDLVDKVDFIFHLAGVNRSKNLNDFITGNEILTYELCEAIRKTNKKIPVIYSSSVQANLNNPYGVSKNKAENLLFNLKKEHNVPVYIYRLPNIFGKWCKPNYNSVVATFCYNIIRDIPININNPKNLINLVYIDDVISDFIMLMDNFKKISKINKYQTVNPLYKITVGNLAKQIYAFKEIRNSNILERVGKGFVRALYSTYISYLPQDQFSYPVRAHSDQRGSFIEMIKTPDCGQFSCFTILPNVTRGDHYHHSKTEKFLVINGNARFKFYNLDTHEKYEIEVNGDKPEIVESVPGWAHNITNIGKVEITVMIWANEIFDHSKPDTFINKI
ncbi:SDR family oxidoreductase [Pelagibacterales bacterium SAG-MED22]|nr:SDR family oxidoreductase [Pelagibacterales bacterium SAG-MED22]